LLAKHNLTYDHVAPYLMVNILTIYLLY